MVGIYNLVIKDGNGCIVNVDFEVYFKLNLFVLLIKELDCIINLEVVIILIIIGGNMILVVNYIYEVLFNSGGFVLVFNLYLVVVVGNYVFRVIDVNNVIVC